MYKEFCVTDLKLSLPNKSITIGTNFKIEEKTVNLSTVKLKDASNGDLQDYTVETKGSRIIVYFKDYPKQNYKYIISVSKEITDKLDRNLNSSFEKTIEFESQIKYKTSIVSPKSNQTIKGKDLNISINISPDDDEVEKLYNYQVSLDTAFCDIVYDCTTEDKECLSAIENDGQYFIRARVISKEDNNVVGEWSEVIGCVMVETNDCTCDDNEEEGNDISNNNKEELSPFLEDMLSMDPVLMETEPLKIINIEPNGMTGETMFVYFNQDLEEIPDNLLMLRRDL